MNRVCRLVLLVYWLTIVNFIDADDTNIAEDMIDEDYYFGSALRTQSSSEFCLRKLPTFICEMECFRNHICVDGYCKCINPDSPTLVPKKSLEFIDLTTMFKANNLPQYEQRLPQRPTRTRAIEAYSKHPILRHHIAHFCPNLDDARVCIRKCMKVGKPAFCGKDHVCYCGHKYTDPVDDKGGDAEAIYAQFKDMYEKYFGKGYRPK